MADEATLSQRMRQLSWMPKGEPRAEELRSKADALDAAIEQMGAEGGVKRMLGAWARARRLWCDVTGETLV